LIEPKSRTKNRSFARRNAGELSETSEGSSGVPATGGTKTRGRKDSVEKNLSKPFGRRRASGRATKACCTKYLPEAAYRRRWRLFANRERKTSVRREGTEKSSKGLGGGANQETEKQRNPSAARNPRKQMAAQTLALGDEIRTHGVAFSTDKSGPGRTN
jgi:hypothetical protein